MAMRNMMNTITLITIRNTPQTISQMMYQRILTIQSCATEMRILQVQWIALSVLCSLLLSFWVSFVKFYNSVSSSVQYLAECRLVHSLVFSPLSVLAYK